MKGPNTTTLIFGTHLGSHDFTGASPFRVKVITRKVLSSGIAHVALVLFWVGGSTFPCANFSNFDVWVRDPIETRPLSYPVTELLGQDILNYPS